MGRIWPLKNNSSAEVMDSGEEALVGGNVEKSNSNEELASDAAVVEKAEGYEWRLVVESTKCVGLAGALQ